MNIQTKHIFIIIACLAAVVALGLFFNTQAVASISLGVLATGISLWTLVVAIPRSRFDTRS
jgi:hypothetical protein